MSKNNSDKSSRRGIIVVVLIILAVISLVLVYLLEMGYSKRIILWVIHIQI